MNSYLELIATLYELLAYILASLVGGSDLQPEL